MRRVSWLCLGCLIVMTGCRRGNDTTPKEVYEEAMEARGREDMKTYLAHLTPDSRKVLVGRTAISLLNLQETGITAGDIGHLFTSHGLAPEALRAARKEDADRKTTLESAKTLGEKVSDPAAFLGEAMSLLKKSSKGDADDGAEKKETKLAVVTIEGDTARGRLEGGGITGDVHFLHLDGSWKIDLLPLFKEKRPGFEEAAPE